MVCQATSQYTLVPVCIAAAQAAMPGLDGPTHNCLVLDSGVLEVAPLPTACQASSAAGCNSTLLVWLMAPPGNSAITEAYNEVRVGGTPLPSEQSKPSVSALRRRRRQRADLLQRAGHLVASRTGEGLGPEAREEEGAALVEDLGAGGEARQRALEALRGHVEVLAFGAAGCRAVQLALDVADGCKAAELAAELRGHVLRAVRSPHANYVLQKAILTLPTAQSAFIAEELRGTGEKVACHRFGCRIFCRLLEHCASSVATEALVDEALEKAQTLCCHTFGHYVAQAVLEHGLERQRQAVAAALLANLPAYMRHHSACHVLVDALSSGSAKERRAIVDRIFAVPDLVGLAEDKFGSKVLQALLVLPGEESKGLVPKLWAAAGQLQTTQHGRKLAESLGL
mmetsp:Transcript_15813/g.36958  ORF Transcript_15813/g.36958 Transcript_15813/m.36958 type:complete len:398 (+) Transcript_15813:25-1218(+)